MGLKKFSPPRRPVFPELLGLVLDGRWPTLFRQRVVLISFKLAASLGGKALFLRPFLFLLMTPALDGHPFLVLGGSVFL